MKSTENKQELTIKLKTSAIHILDDISEKIGASRDEITIREKQL